MARPIVFGVRRSVYVRIARLALEEKGVAYDLDEVDVFAPGGPPPAYLERQPFGRMPAFEHDGFRLYESGAITRYVDEAFPGPALQPSTPRERARVNQIVSIVDSYAYRTMVWDVMVERLRAREVHGRDPDEAKIAAALKRAETCCRALADLTRDGPWLTGPAATLADLHAAPIFAYFRRTPEGAAMLARHGTLQRWWDAVDARPSMAATRFPVELA